MISSAFSNLTQTRNEVSCFKQGVWQATATHWSPVLIKQYTGHAGWQ